MIIKKKKKFPTQNNILTSHKITIITWYFTLLASRLDINQQNM